jgi:hypothetical protein
MTVKLLVDSLFANSSLVMVMEEFVRHKLIEMASILGFIGALFVLMKIIIARESLSSFTDYLRTLTLPAVIVALLSPMDINGDKTFSNYGIAVGTTKVIFDTTAEMTDAAVVRLNDELRKYGLAGGGDFVSFANGFLEVSKNYSEKVRSELENNLHTSLNDPSFLSGTGGELGAALTVGLGAAIFSGVSSITDTEGGVFGVLKKVFTLPKAIISGLSGGASVIMSFAFAGMALDLIWRFLTLLWLLKVSVIIVLVPVGVVVGLLAWEWGISNLSRIFLNVIGIALTPLTMVAIYSGAVFLYTLIPSIIDGLGSQGGNFLDSMIQSGTGIIIKIAINLVYPVMVGMALMRSGELISYVITGVSAAFAFAGSAQGALRPQSIAGELTGRPAM